MTQTHTSPPRTRATASRAGGLLLNAIQRSAWGEEPDIYFDPEAFVEGIEPAILDALRAVDDRAAMASIIIDLYRSHGESGTLGRLLRASVGEGSEAMGAAFVSTLRETGPKALEPFRQGLWAEDGAVGYLLESIRTAVQAMSDSFAADALLEECAEALLVADDPWSVLGVLLEELWVFQGWVISRETTDELFWRHLQTEVASEGCEPLWKGYRYLMYDLGELDDVMEYGIVLQDAYREAVRAVNDPHWIADRILEVCSTVSYTEDDWSCWLPNRTRVVRACVTTIRAARGPRATDRILFLGLLDDPSEAVDSLLDVTREAVAGADDPVEAVGALVHGLCGEPLSWPPRMRAG